MNRLSQRDLLPSSIKNRGLGDVVRVSENAEASSTISNGEDTVFTLVFINQMDADMIAEPEFSLWKTSVSAANLIPNGSGIDMSQFQIVGPWNEWTEVLLTDGAIDVAVPKFAIVSRIYIRNISAGASTVIVARARVRYITNFDVTSLS